MRPCESAAPRAATRKLLRYLASGRALVAGTVAAAGGTAVVLKREGEGVRRFRRDLLLAAISRGLVVRDAGFVALDPSGLAWLKRSMCASDPFAAQHGERRVEPREVDGERREVTVNIAESPLAGLARLKRKDGRPFLDAPLIAAGERLRADFTRGLLHPRVTADWDRNACATDGRRRKPRRRTE